MIHTLCTEGVLEASVVAVWWSVVHGQVNHVHVVGVRLERRVVVVVMVVVIVVVIVWGRKVLQRGHIGCWRQPGYDDRMVPVVPALGWSRWVTGTWRNEQGSLHCLWVRGGRGVQIGWVFWGWTHTRPLGICHRFRGWAHPLP